MAVDKRSEAIDLSVTLNKAILALRKNINFNITIIFTQFNWSHNCTVLGADLKFPDGTIREFQIVLDSVGLIDLPTGLVLKHGWDKYKNLNYKSKEEENIIRLAFWIYAYAKEYRLMGQKNG